MFKFIEFLLIHEIFKVKFSVYIFQHIDNASLNL